MCYGSKTRINNMYADRKRSCFWHVGFSILSQSRALPPRMETRAGLFLASLPSFHQNYPGTFDSMIIRDFFSWKYVRWVGVAGHSLEPTHHAEVFLQGANPFDDHVDVQIVGSTFDQRGLGAQVIREDYQSSAPHLFREKLEADKNGKSLKFQYWCLLVRSHDGGKQSLINDFTKAHSVRI